MFQKGDHIIFTGVDLNYPVRTVTIGKSYLVVGYNYGRAFSIIDDTKNISNWTKGFIKDIRYTRKKKLKKIYDKSR